MAAGRWAATFSSLRVRNYRLYFTGQLVSVSGTWMQTVAQSFLVLRLTDSGTALGFTTAARFAPIFVLGPWGGAVADRLDRRRLLYVTQTLSGLLALTFGLLITERAIELWTVYVLALALGFVNVFDSPARQAFISELVPRDQLRNAVTLNSVTVNLARVLGAAVGGTIVSTLGLALCFDLNAVSFAAVLASLAAMRASETTPRQREPRERGQIRAALHYVRTTPGLLVPLSMIAVVGTLAWEFQITLPLVAKDTFHGGAGTYGAMASVMGLGAVVGGLVAASRARVRMRSLALASLGWGASITIAGIAPSLVTEYVVLAFVGYGSITFNSLAKTTLQLNAAQEMRGRVMALWAVAWQGSTPIGGPIVGWVSEELGARWSLLIGGLPTLAIGLACYPVLVGIDRRRAAAGPGPGPRPGTGQDAGTDAAPDPVVA